MMLLVALVCSVPLGLFLAWFAWQARKVGKLDAARAMGMLAGLLLLAGGGAGAWLAAALGD